MHSRFRLPERTRGSTRKHPPDRCGVVRPREVARGLHPGQTHAISGLRGCAPKLREPADLQAFPKRLPYLTRIGTRDGRCSHFRVRIARRARESGERPSMFPVMSSGRSSPVRSASAASGAPLLRFKDPAAMAYTIMRRRTPGPRPERASVDVQWSRSRRRTKRKRDSGLRSAQRAWAARRKESRRRMPRRRSRRQWVAARGHEAAPGSAVRVPDQGPTRDYTGATDRR
jgi:hypothetical protein